MSEKTNTTGALDIGAVLSAARMKRDLSIATAAMQSNLSQEIIERLEQNRFAEIGAPVFTRGYLGLYARFLGLNEAAVSQAFNKIKSEPAPELRLTAANIESQARPYRRRSYLGSWLLLIPVVAIGGILLYQLFDNNSWLMTQINGAFNAPQASGETTPAEGGSANGVLISSQVLIAAAMGFLTTQLHNGSARIMPAMMLASTLCGITLLFALSRHVWLDKTRQ